jgi:pSer/pThr/pTyr-binding forkhead associated (FHA) protein
MLETGSDACLALESLHEALVEAELRREDLDRDIAAQSLLECAIHHRHPAAADLRLDLVLPAQRLARNVGIGSAGWTGGRHAPWTVRRAGASRSNRSDRRMREALFRPCARPMSFLIIGTERYALPIGDTRLGGTGEDALSAPELASIEPVATITVLADHSATIRRTSTHAVALNDMPIGSAPVALLHGTRITIGAVRLLFGDIRANGSTMHVAGVTTDELKLLGALVASDPTTSAGGRLVSRDGTITPIPDSGLEIGRDPACGLALAPKDVSRRHARIAPALLGYVLTDLSANGVRVNGVAIEKSHVLGYGDVIGIGSVELVFEGERAFVEPVTAPLPQASPASSPSATAPPQVGSESSTPHSPLPLPLPLLATLEIINEGPLKGTRFRLERPVAHIGRGPSNEIRLRDESVSGSHATLTRRGAQWVVLDLGSTNGTYVDGDRITGERVIAGVSEVRFGGIKMVFRPIAGSADDDLMSTRAIVGIRDDQR